MYNRKTVKDVTLLSFLNLNCVRRQPIWKSAFYVNLFYKLYIVQEDISPNLLH